VSRHIHFESGFGSEEADHQLRRRALFRRLALSRSEYLVMPSLTLVDIATNIWRIPVDKQRHIPNGVDCEVYASPPENKALPGFVREPGELVVGTVAPLRSEKNVGRLISAFAEIKDRFPVRLVVAGDGAERRQLEKLTAELGAEEQVHFAGSVDKVESILGYFDVFALSSDTEQMPNSILQAMAAGLPIVATDVGDVAHILAPDNRQYVVEKSTSKFAAALGELLLDIQLRNKLGHSNQAHVRAHYDLAKMVDAYETIFSA
jgi:glycosyltransferase involved in cell wall biosynthesis